ncbi:MAG: hypothetical protein MUF56_09915 [Solirubrobacteraceae bacterium]|nr:hypothetical protein [Solirubrobacteraceae bacterium]
MNSSSGTSTPPSGVQLLCQPNTARRSFVRRAFVHSTIGSPWEVAPANTVPGAWTALQRTVPVVHVVSVASDPGANTVTSAFSVPEER